MDELARWRSAGLRGRGEKESESQGNDAQDRDNRDDVGGDGGAAQSAAAARTEGPTKSVAQSGSANVMVLAATNAPEAVDAAFLRPGRFDEVIGAGLGTGSGSHNHIQAKGNFLFYYALWALGTRL